MNSMAVKSLFFLLWSIVVACGITGQRCNGQTNPRISSREVRSAVKRYLQSPPLSNFEATSYLLAFVRLNDRAGDSKPEAVVLLTGSGWCGTGGCTLLVLTPQGSGYTVISRTPAIRLPVRVLESESRGWHDLSVWTQGGGILRGYEEIVRFDGESYARSPEGFEDRRVGGMKGKIVLSLKDKEIPLYR